MRRRLRIAALVGVGFAAGLGIWGARVPYDPGDLDPGRLTSVRILDRTGELLRSTLDSDGARVRWVDLAEVSPRLIEATRLTEDRRFRRHPGFDPVAVMRALGQNLKAGRVVSGGSTITQQLAGLVWPEPRTIAGKLRETLRALRLERDFSKDEILAHYLNRLPYGPGIQGIGAAADIWFDCVPQALDAVEAATLAALPQAPGRFAKPENRHLLRARRNRILELMSTQGSLPPAEMIRGQDLPLDMVRNRSRHRAGHFADHVLLGRGRELLAATTLVTTLDLELQKDVEAIVSVVLDRIPEAGATQCAVVVLDVARGEVLALVGSESWQNAREGQVNGALALRQPGSALKPFIYALAFEGGASAADLLPDVPFARADARGQVVAPRNYDHRFRGPVRMREALGSSLNVPAVVLQDRLGEGAALAVLRSAGLTSLDDDPAKYGLGLTLGVGEVTLLELTAAYGGLARGGSWSPPVTMLEARDARNRVLPLERTETRQWTIPEAVFLVNDVLVDDRARAEGFGLGSVLRFPFPVAVKTGTSTGYRDSWCVGFTGDHVVGVWVGNFDGTPMRGSSGVAAAGPVFRQTVLRLHEKGSRPFIAASPDGWQTRPVCTLSGQHPGETCRGVIGEWFAPGQWEEREPCTFHEESGEESGEDPAIHWPAAYRGWAEERHLAGASIDDGTAVPSVITPVEGTIYVLDPRAPGQERLRVVIDPAARVTECRMDGRPFLPGEDGVWFWTPQRGEHVIEVAGPAGISRRRFAVR